MKDYLKVTSLFAGYSQKNVLKDLNFSVEKGSVFSLIGPNGSGKSTLLKVLAGELPLKSGSILLEGKALSSIPQKQLAKKLAVVWTERLRPELMTCFEVAAMGRYPYTGWFGKLSGADCSIVFDALEQVEMEHFSNHPFLELSDGQQQRVLLARAIAQQPELLILDEPTAFLDIRYQLQFLKTVRSLAEKGTTVVLSIHEPELALRFSDCILCLKDGENFALSTPEELVYSGQLNALYDLKEGDISFRLWKEERV